MPKIKTRKSAKKRFRQTSTGKLLHRKTGKNHNLSKKRSSRRRRLSGISEVIASAKRTIKRLTN